MRQLARVGWGRMCRVPKPGSPESSHQHAFAGVCTAMLHARISRRSKQHRRCQEQHAQLLGGLRRCSAGKYFWSVSDRSGYPGSTLSALTRGVADQSRRPSSTYGAILWVRPCLPNCSGTTKGASAAPRIVSPGDSSDHTISSGGSPALWHSRSCIKQHQRSICSASGSWPRSHGIL